MDPHIPPEIEDAYEGEWIAWDTVTNQVIAHAKTLDEVMDQTTAAVAANRLIWYHHVLPGDIEIVGGF
jgi:hypothetical protein